VRHRACTGFEGVSCACGVAMRENDAILIADMCHNDTALAGVPKYVTIKAKDLPNDARITVSSSGRRFKVNDICLTNKLYASSVFITMSFVVCIAQSTRIHM